MKGVGDDNQNLFRNHAPSADQDRERQRERAREREIAFKDETER